MRGRVLSVKEKLVLIAEVETRPVLWDNRVRGFKNVNVTKKAWEEVGAILRIPGVVAKSKWKNMKDKYRREVQNLLSPAYPLGPTEPKSYWPFFQRMMFVKDVVMPKSLTETLEDEATPCFPSFACSSSPSTPSGPTGKFESDNIPLSKHPDADEDDHEDNVTDDGNDDVELINDISDICDENVDSNALLGENTQKQSSFVEQRRVKKQKTDTFDEKLLELEERKLQVMERGQDERGADYHFLMSLLPYMKDLNPLANLELRGKIINDVLEAVKAHKASNN
ncbi:uncharacterized protein [Anabrus simplex]|uniref:uncharacterized protein n=1 Tax=Anabrus simplex TaxID=316456 RepID=UPI0035A3C74A